MASSYFINEIELVQPLKVEYGGTSISSYSTGDMIYASAPTNLNTISIGPAGNVLQSNGTNPYWGPANNNAFLFTYQPGFVGPAGTNVYADWNDLYTAFSNTFGEKWITFDATTAPIPGTVTIPAGTYNLQNAVFYYPFGGNVPSLPIVTIDIDDGVIISNLASINGPILVRYNGTTSPCITLSSPVNLLSMTNASSIRATQTQPFIDVSSGAGLIVSLGYGASIGTASTVPTINVDGQLQVNMVETGPTIGDTNTSNTNAISGTGFFQIIANNQSFSIVPLTASRYPLFTGTFNYTNGSNTARMVVSNSAAGPTVNDDISFINPKGTIWLSVNPVNQNTYVSVDDTTGAAVWKQFAYVATSSTAGNVILGPGGTVTINTTSVTSTSVILATFAYAPPSGTLYINNINPGVSFDIVSTNAGDAGMSVFWYIVS